MESLKIDGVESLSGEKNCNGSREGASLDGDVLSRRHALARIVAGAVAVGAAIVSGCGKPGDSSKTPLGEKPVLDYVGEVSPEHVINAMNEVNKFAPDGTLEELIKMVKITEDGSNLSDESIENIKISLADRLGYRVEDIEYTGFYRQSDYGENGELSPEDVDEFTDGTFSVDGTEIFEISVSNIPNMEGVNYAKLTRFGEDGNSNVETIDNSPYNRASLRSVHRYEYVDPQGEVTRVWERLSRDKIYGRGHPDVDYTDDTWRIEMKGSSSRMITENFFVTFTQGGTPVSARIFHLKPKPGDGYWYFDKHFAERSDDPR